MKNSQEIKQALIQIAERKDRPHYTALVVRDVIAAFKNNTSHALKNEVEDEKVFFVTTAYRDVQLDELIAFCNRTGMKNILAEKADVTVGTISRVLTGSREMSKTLWLKLSAAFEEADQAYRYKRDPRRKSSARNWSTTA